MMLRISLVYIEKVGVWSYRVNVHDVTVFAIPEFKSLEVLENIIFYDNIIVYQPQH